MSRGHQRRQPRSGLWSARPKQRPWASSMHAPPWWTPRSSPECSGPRQAPQSWENILFHQERRNKAMQRPCQLRPVLAPRSPWHSHFADEKTEAQRSKANFPKSGGTGARQCLPASISRQAEWRGRGWAAGTPSLSPHLLRQPVMGSPAGPPSSTDPGEPSPIRPAR